jgi:WD40 repeat protein
VRGLALVIVVAACGPATPARVAPGAAPPRAAAAATSLDSRYLRHGGHAFALAWVPGTATLVSVGADERICIWDTARATLVRSIALPDQMTELAVSPDGASIAVAGTGQLTMYAAATGAERWTVDWHYYQPRALAFVADGRLFVAADTGYANSAFVGLLDPATGDVGHVFTGRIDATKVEQLRPSFTSAVVARSGAWAAATLKDGPVVVMHVDGTRRELAGERPDELGVSGDDAWLFVDGADDVAWRTSDWSPTKVDFAAVGYGRRAFAIPGTASWLVVGNEAFATATAPGFALGPAHAAKLDWGRPVAVDADAVATAQPEGIVVYDRATGQRRTPPRAHHGPVHAVDVSPRGDRALTAEEGAVHLWSLPDGTHLGALPIVDADGRRDRIETARWRVDGRTALVAAGTRLLRIDTAPALTATALIEGDAFVDRATPAPDGERWAAVLHDANTAAARLVLGAPGEDLREIARWSGYRQSVCLDFVDGDRLVHGYRDPNAPFGRGAVEVHDLATGTTETLANAMRGSGCATSPAGINASVESDDPGYSGTMPDTYVAFTRLVDRAALGRYTLRIAGGVVRFAPDGTRLAVAAEAHRPWNVGLIEDLSAQPDRVALLDTAGTELALITGHAGRIHDLAFSPDGGTLYGAGEDGTVHIWPVPRR